MNAAKYDDARVALAAHYPCRVCVGGDRSGMCREATRLYGVLISALHEPSPGMHIAPNGEHYHPLVRI